MNIFRVAEEKAIPSWFVEEEKPESTHRISGKD